MMKRYIGLLIITLFLTQLVSAQGENLTGVNCAVTPDQLLGQANVGFAGAANVGFAGAAGDVVRNANLELDAAQIVADWQYSGAGEEPVAIVIIDDFSSDEPVAAADWTTASHGWLVNEVFMRLYAQLPPEVADNIQFETIDVADETISFRSDRIQEALAETVDTLSAQGISRFVVNMSFVFVACQDGNFNFMRFLEERENNPNHTVIEEAGGSVADVTTILSDNSVERVDPSDNRGPRRDVLQRLAFLRLFELSQLNSDPLRDYLRDNQDVTIIAVASAGNLKWRRPFYPASWPEVLGVSALAGTGGDLWTLSNNGEVSAPGAYFFFDDDTYRAGTSFAAPVVSLMVAVDLTQATPTCGIQGNSPALASNGQNDDVPLLDAVADRC
jgi:hypothetical protein